MADNVITERNFLIYEKKNGKRINNPDNNVHDCMWDSVSTGTDK